MTDLEDPSRARDATAAALATDRNNQARETATQRSDDAVTHGKELSDMVHRMKGELSANTVFTREVADKARDIAEAQRVMVAKQDVIVSAITDIRAEIAKVNVDELAEATSILTSMKGGFVVLGWIGGAAKWIASIAGAVALIIAAIYWTPPK